MEFVPSTTIQKVLEDCNNNVQTFLERKAYEKNQDLKKVKENYMLTNVGYAVATYILAIGDRHLENLMLKDDGSLFHLDFGFILGKKPPFKDWEPPIRINKEMVLGLGGIESNDYLQFKNRAADAFLNLRDHSNFITNIFYLMIDAQIPDLPESDHEEILNKLHGRFMKDKDLTNEDAR